MANTLELTEHTITISFKSCKIIEKYRKQDMGFLNQYIVHQFLTSSLWLKRLLYFLCIFKNIIDNKPQNKGM